MYIQWCEQDIISVLQVRTKLIYSSSHDRNTNLRKTINTHRPIANRNLSNSNGYR